MLKSYENRDTALKRVDLIYSQGYPLHVAYWVRPAEATEPCEIVLPLIEACVWR